MKSKKGLGILIGVCLALVLILATFIPANAAQVPVSEPVSAASVPKTSEVSVVLPPDVAPVVFMSGTPYEMGYQYGEQARDYIRIASSRCWAMQMGWYNNDKAYIEKNLAQLAKALAREMPEMNEIFKGMADGAGLKYNDIMIICAWDKPPACTGISAFKSATPDSKTIAGQNFDFGWNPFSYQVITVLFPSKESGLYSFIAPTPAGLMAPTGMNEKGLVFTGNGMPAQDQQQGSRTLDGVSTLLSGAYIPMKCDTVENAKNLAIKIKVTAGVNYHLIDVAGNAFCVSGNAAGMMARAPGDNIIITGKSGDPIYTPTPNHMVCTNHYVNPAQVSWNPTTPYTSSINRFRTAEKMLSDKLGSLTVKDFMDILGSRKYWDGSAWQPASGDDWTGNSINRHSPGPSGTIYTMICVPADKVAYFSTGDALGDWGSGAPGTTGQFVKLVLKESPAKVTEEAAKAAVANIAEATKALNASSSPVLLDRLNEAKACYWEGLTYQSDALLLMSEIATEPGQKTGQERLNRALALFGKAATYFCKAQVYALQVKHANTP